MEPVVLLPGAFSTLPYAAPGLRILRRAAATTGRPRGQICRHGAPHRARARSCLPIAAAAPTDVLCFSVLPAAPSHGLTLNVDDEMVYRGFFADFGPLDIAHVRSQGAAPRPPPPTSLTAPGPSHQVTTLCRRLRALVGRARKSGALVTFWARNHHHKIANAALLAAAYLVRCHTLAAASGVLSLTLRLPQVLCERRDAEAAFEPFMGAPAPYMPLPASQSPSRPFPGVYPPLVPFRDACFGLCTFPLSVLDCLRGIQRVRPLPPPSPTVPSACAAHIPPAGGGGGPVLRGRARPGALPPPRAAAARRP